MPTREAGVSALKGTRVDLRIRMSHFQVPPVQSALVVGKRAPIGTNAMLKALNEIAPGAFERADTDHSTIEAIIVRSTHLQCVPKERLVELIVRHAEAFMSEGDLLRVDIEVEVSAEDSLEL